MLLSIQGLQKGEQCLPLALLGSDPCLDWKGPRPTEMALPTWPVPGSSAGLCGCPACATRLCEALFRDGWSMRGAVGLCWLLAPHCQPGLPSPTPGREGVTMLCLADICGTAWSILVPRQPASHKSDGVSECHQSGGQADCGV